MIQRTVRVIAGHAVGVVRKAFDKLSEPIKAQQLAAAAVRRAAESGQITGKSVLITGSTRGIGRALAEGFAAAGANVAVHGRLESEAIAVAAEIRRTRSPSGAIVGVGADLASSAAGRTLVESAIRQLGGLDLVINNAGIHDPTRKPIWTTTTEEMLRLLQVNLIAAFETSTAAISQMTERGVAGRIINISTSVASPAHVVDSGIASYGISKIALEGLSQYLAAESKAWTITTLRPSTLATDMVAPLFTVDQRWRLLPPESIVPAAIYLATAPRAAVHGRVFDQVALTTQLAKAGNTATFRAEAVSGEF